MKSVGIMCVVGCVLLGAVPAWAADPAGTLRYEEAGWLMGWAQDEDDPGAALRVHFYVDADGPGRRILGQTQAKYEDERLADTNPQGHAFAWRIPAALRDGKEHTVTAFALNVGEGANVPLPESVTFSLSPVQRDFSSAVDTQLDVKGNPEVWMCKGNPWVLSESEEWPFVREAIDCIVLYVDAINTANAEQLRAFAAMQREHGFKVAVELGGLVDWEAEAKDQSGERSFACEYEKVRKFTDSVEEGGAGGAIHWLNIDGPFRRMIYPNGKEAGLHTLKSAGQELVDCLLLWREKYPSLKFNLLTNFYNYGWKGAPAYNDFGFEPGPEGWGDYKRVLDTALKATRQGGIFLDGLTIDAPYDYARGDHQSNQDFVIRDIDFLAPVIALEGYARREGLYVRTIYNSETPGNRETGSDKAYFEETLAYMDTYHAKGGRPDAYIIQTWYARPTEWLPEDKPYTMTNLVKTAIKKVKHTPE